MPRRKRAALSICSCSKACLVWGLARRRVEKPPRKIVALSICAATYEDTHTQNKEEKKKDKYD